MGSEQQFLDTEFKLFSKRFGGATRSTPPFTHTGVHYSITDRGWKMDQDVFCQKLKPFYIPKDRKQREKWLLRLNVEEPSPRTNKRICLRHFRTLDIKKGVKRVHLKDNVHTLHPSTETD